MPILIPILLIGGGVALAITLAISGDTSPVPDHQPDASAAPGRTGYRLVDAILPQLSAASQSSGIPLGLIVGWIAKESGGKIGEKTSLGELGLFQLDPGEQKKTGFTDQARLSSDVDYSINAGLALIGIYSGMVDRAGVKGAPHGTAFFWLLTKLWHTVGEGAALKWVQAAQGEGVAGSWESFSKYCTAHDSDLLHSTKHSPLKWIPFIEQIYAIGKPFGFGSGPVDNVAGAPGAVPGGPIFDDIPDPITCLNS